MLPSSWISLLSGTLGASLNLTIIPLILIYSTKNMGRYKYLMVSYTTSAILYCISQATVLPTYFLFDGGFVLCSSATYESKEFKLIGLFIFCSTFALVEIIVCLCFIFRYGVMCSERVLHCFEPSLKMAGLLLFAFFSWLIPSILFATLTPSDLVISKSRQATGLTCLGGPLFLSSGELYSPMVYALLSFLVLTTLTISLDVFCIVKIRRTLKKAAEDATIRMQKKLLILLYLQTVLPIIFNGTPSAMMLVFTLIQTSPGSAPQYISSVMSVAQICDPILVITLVGNYRTALWKLLGRKTTKIVKTSSHEHGPQVISYKNPAKRKAMNTRRTTWHNTIRYPAPLS